MSLFSSPTIYLFIYLFVYLFIYVFIYLLINQFILYLKLIQKNDHLKKEVKNARNCSCIQKHTTNAYLSHSHKKQMVWKLGPNEPF